MKGKGLDYKKHCQIPFGAYVQVNNDPRFKNTLSPRALDAIYVKPNGNAQRGHTVMDLNSGKLIDRPRVIEVPITPTIIKAVERIAAKQKAYKGLKMTNKHGNPYSDVDLSAGVDRAVEEEYMK